MASRSFTLCGIEFSSLSAGTAPGAAGSIEPGASVSWKIDLYVPDRAGSEPGGLEVRVGFEAGDEPDAVAETAAELPPQGESP